MNPHDWILSRDTGVSSKAIWGVMMGAKPLTPWDAMPPSDSGDFGRCHRLLQAFPLWEIRLEEVAATYPEWRPIVDNWAELKSLYEDALKAENERDRFRSIARAEHSNSDEATKTRLEQQFKKMVNEGEIKRNLLFDRLQWLKKQSQCKKRLDVATPTTST